MKNATKRSLWIIYSIVSFVIALGCLYISWRELFGNKTGNMHPLFAIALGIYFFSCGWDGYKKQKQHCENLRKANDDDPATGA